MSDVKEMLKNIDYKNVLGYFAEISDIPRGSGDNKRISDYLVAFAKNHNLRYVQDEALNVIIYKDATAGYEAHTPVIIQGHMDMVCVKEEDSNHDFTKDGLELILEGNILHANKTTLGGDDGIAVAYGLALLADDTIKHPALEILITTDEETGMDGAKALDPSLLKGKHMINVDSEDEGVVLVSCAGGLRVYGELPVRRQEMEGTSLKIVVSGLKGGHSGAEIHKSRTNATLLLARTLMCLSETAGYSMVSMKGGEKDNAIPAYAEATILVDAESAEEVVKKVQELNEVFKKELSSAEPDVNLAVTLGGNEKVNAVHAVDFEKILFVLIQAPNSVQVMSSDIEGLVESSLNLGIFSIDEDKAQYHYALRSSKSSYKQYMTDKLLYLITFLGGECEATNDYPAWEYKKESKFRELFAEVFEKEYGHPCKMEAIHAGLECGLISEKIPDIDIVSIGPDMKDIHSPREQLDVESAIRVYKFLEKLLEAMK
ncbi:MAG: aminoacyl-histidine dipeptidase [Lachnospiraceae bacterium]|nr:aminoacyl-histidine dipeptidase [Lachnospiraceae bacterium]